MNEKNILGKNVGEYTVSEISHAIKRTLEGAYDRVRVRGEVGRPNYHSSGHLYLTLKDADAAMDAVAWRGTVNKLKLRLAEGMEILATGRISSYPKNSRYQIIIETVELAGEGALLKLFEKRREKLLGEGLFDAEKKIKIPYLPSTIGVVTSPTGAVIRDILQRLDDRFPRKVLLWPVPVQGNGAAEKIADAIKGFNALPKNGKLKKPEVLIIARGGGSLEDLWQFNEEVVVRAVAESEIPLISAVGHETDTTLIDFAADLRAPTPSAAAEMAVPVRSDLLANVFDNEKRLVQSIQRTLEERDYRIQAISRGLPREDEILAHPSQTFDNFCTRLNTTINMRLDQEAGRLIKSAALIRYPKDFLALKASELEKHELRVQASIRSVLRNISVRLQALQLSNRMLAGMEHKLSRFEEEWKSLGKILESLSFQRVLERGFTLVTDKSRKPVIEAVSANTGQALNIQFRDGEIGVIVQGPKLAEKEHKVDSTKESSVQVAANRKNQGSLF